MKTFVIALFSLVLFASGAAWGQNPPEPKMPYANIPMLPGAPAICKTNNGILIIVVNSDGDVVARQCEKLGTKPIGRKVEPTTGLTVKSVGSLGSIMKWQDPTGKIPDPCVTWVISGTSYTYCW